MGLFSVFDTAGSGMSVQSIRLNTIASNMANANNVSTTAEQAYRSRQPVFQAVLDEHTSDTTTAGVRMLGIVEKQAEPRREYSPSHPLANEEGYIFHSNVDPIEEMVNMISASRSFQNNVEVVNTSKQLLLAVLRLGE